MNNLVRFLVGDIVNFDYSRLLQAVLQNQIKQSESFQRLLEILETFFFESFESGLEVLTAYLAAVMESWLDVQPLRIPRPKLLSSGVETGNEIRTMTSEEIIKSNNFEVKCESVRKKIPVASK